MPKLVRLKRTPSVRALMFILGDMIVWAAALVGGYLIRFDLMIPPGHLAKVVYILPVLIAPKIVWHMVYRLYSLTWRLVGLTDLLNVWRANTLGSITAFGLLFLLRSHDMFHVTSRSVLVLDYLLSLAGIGLFRIGRRLWSLHKDARRRSRNKARKRILLVGAGAAGERLVRAMLDDPSVSYAPIGFIDDDPSKIGTYVHGLRVFGGRANLPEVVQQQRVSEVVISIPSASSAQIRAIVEATRRSGVTQVRILPGVHELLTSRVGLRDLREVNLDDLLGRPPVKIAIDAIAAFLAGKRVLVTGAAGSVGSEIIRQITRFPCQEIVALDVNESGLFELEEAVRSLPREVPLRAVIADIRDREKIDWVLRTYRPQVLFHAAAYKHVPLMERFAEEAVKTNVLGTLNVAEAAMRSEVETFVLISTDKAVQPKSVLGATKRVAEKCVQALSRRGKTRFLVVRFGNVLGSRGSLIPVLQDQIRRGGPVTLTHPDMRRFFMSAAEAVLLVLQAALTDKHAGVFLLDMGQPVRIVDLATELIKLSGLEPDKDIPIVFTGIRPGEKLEEELSEPDEVVLPTQFDGIFEVETNGVPDEITLRLAFQEVDRLATAVDGEGIRALLMRLASPSGAEGQILSAAIAP